MFFIIYITNFNTTIPTVAATVGVTVVSVKHKKCTANGPVDSAFDKTERKLNHDQNKNVNNNTEIGLPLLHGQAVATNEHIEMSEEYKQLKPQLTARVKETSLFI